LTREYLAAGYLVFVSSGEELDVVDEDSTLTVNDFVADLSFECDGCCRIVVNVVRFVVDLDFVLVFVCTAGCTFAASGEIVVI
jgi:hypothetical protein